LVESGNGFLRTTIDQGDPRKNASYRARKDRRHRRHYPRQSRPTPQGPGQEGQGRPDPCPGQRQQGKDHRPADVDRQRFHAVLADHLGDSGRHPRASGPVRPQVGGPVHRGCRAGGFDSRQEILAALRQRGQDRRVPLPSLELALGRGEEGAQRGEHRLELPVGSSHLLGARHVRHDQARHAQGLLPEGRQ